MYMNHRTQNFSLLKFYSVRIPKSYAVNQCPKENEDIE